jgi:hypothetical protein
MGVHAVVESVHAVPLAVVLHPELTGTDALGVAPPHGLLVVVLYVMAFVTVSSWQLQPPLPATGATLLVMKQVDGDVLAPTAVSGTHSAIPAV